MRTLPILIIIALSLFVLLIWRGYVIEEHKSEPDKYTWIDEMMKVNR